MTVAVCVKVHDGLVLAADSASTIVDAQGNVVNVYNNANKIFELCKGLPIGGMTWGAGSLGQSSITTLAKDLRRRFNGSDAAHRDWAVDSASYTLEAVAAATRRFLFEEVYAPTYGSAPAKPSLGFTIAGYSAGATSPEEWRITIDSGASRPPELVQPGEQAGITWSGQPEAISRLVLGHSPQLRSVLADLGAPADQLDTVMGVVAQRLQTFLWTAPMPIQDAIDLAEFLVHCTVMYSRFEAGPQSVGGPIEVSAITKHEGFKWVRRKHYYEPSLNRSEESS